MNWIVRLFGKEYPVEADTSYRAKRKAAQLYKDETRSEFPLPSLTPACRVRRSEQDDKRIKYPQEANGNALVQ